MTVNPLIKIRTGHLGHQPEPQDAGSQNSEGSVGASWCLCPQPGREAQDKERELAALLSWGKRWPGRHRLPENTQRFILGKKEEATGMQRGGGLSFCAAVFRRGNKRLCGQFPAFKGGGRERTWGLPGILKMPFCDGCVCVCVGGSSPLYAQQRWQQPEGSLKISNLSPSWDHGGESWPPCPTGTPSFVLLSLLCASSGGQPQSFRSLTVSYLESKALDGGYDGDL